MNKMRYKGLDILKCLCAFLIVNTHVLNRTDCSTVEMFLKDFDRIAVPIFFMITGYFYENTCRNNKEKSQIKKIGLLWLTGNVIAFAFEAVLFVIKGGAFSEYISECFTIRNIVYMILVNPSPFQGHLWYLSAILYVLIIASVINRIKLKKYIIKMLPVISVLLLVVGIIIGRYSIIILNMNPSVVCSRNWLFDGIPCFCTGYLINMHKEKISNIIQKYPGRTIILCILLTVSTMAEGFFVNKLSGEENSGNILITTLPLATSIFCVFLFGKFTDGRISNIMAVTGREYSTWIYILHYSFVVAYYYIAEINNFSGINSLLISVFLYFITIAFIWICNFLKNKKTKTLKK